MARVRKSRKAKGVRVDLSNVGKAFEPGQEYHVKVVECTLEEGQKAPYFNMKLAGVDEDHETTFMYHRASTSESALWRLRPLLEAFGFDIPEGPMEIDPEDFVGREAMCSTFLDRYEGGSSVKPDEFWPIDGDDDEDEEESDEEDESDEEESDFDLDELDEDEIMALGEALKVKGKKASTVRKKLADMDQDEVEEAHKKLSNDDNDDEEEGDGVSSETVNSASEDELEELIEDHDLEVDLSEYKTLRKKRSAVLAALEEEGLLED